MTRAINIWRLSDGRAGHDNQSLGLVEAISRQHPVRPVTIAVGNAWHGAQQVLIRREPNPRPALLIGAGHATHAGLIVGAWRHHARSIVLMSPSLPCAMFDLCIVPEHDNLRPRDNVVHSVGALNRVLPGTQRDPKLAMILLGGPSRHHAWEQDILFAQIRQLVTTKTSLDWLIASSPRTPEAIMRALSALDHVQLVRFENTASDWLPEKLARASLVWVSEDSMSMAYEALSSGATTGLLAVNAQGLGDNSGEARNQGKSAKRSGDRLATAIQTLRESGRVIATKQWLEGQPLRTSSEPLREADRCARQILERWPDLQ